MVRLIIRNVAEGFVLSTPCLVEFGDVVSVAPFDAQSRVTAWTLATLCVNNGAVLHVVRDRAAHAAVRTDAGHGRGLGLGQQRNRERLVHERPRGTGRCTFATRNTRALAHRQIEIKADASVVTPARSANDLVALNLVAGTDTSVTQNAGRMIDSNDRR